MSILNQDITKSIIIKDNENNTKNQTKIFKSIQIKEETH